MITIRTARAADLPTIMAIERSGFGQEAWSEPSWQAELTGTGRDVLVAIWDHQAVDDQAAEPVGVITIQTVDSSADLNRLVVDGGHRRQGIGTRLIGLGVAVARARGARTMMLEVAADNDPAIMTYQRFGFEQLGSRPDYYSPGRHALIMKLYDLTRPWPSSVDWSPDAADHRSDGADHD